MDDKVPEGLLEDQELIARTKKGDLEAFGALVEKYGDRAVWTAYKLVGNYEDAREIAQTACLRAFRSIARFKQGKKFYTWFYQIIVNLSIDHLRKNRRAASVSIDNVGPLPGKDRLPEDALLDEEVRENVHTTLDELPAKYKAVLVLRDIEELSCKEIARMTGCTHATVRWRLHRARKLFRAAWENKVKHLKGERYGL